MMTPEDVTLLNTQQVKQLIEDNIERDPNAVALDKRLPHKAILATQIKYLQRARKKLPAYYQARAIIPPLAFEQSSSEATAGHKSWCGDTCIDLTCGLGVDSIALSKNFKHVITIERDPLLAEVARINFSRIGATNITVLNEDSAEFIRRFATEGGKADMVYADPDRRSADGRKLVCFEDCSPDITSLLPIMRTIAPKITIKASPLFDVDEALRIFGAGTTVEVVSLGGECKEVLIQWRHGVEGKTISATLIGQGTVSYPSPCANKQENIFSPPYKYIIIPDAALRKARITSIYAAEQLPGSFAAPKDGYIFTDSLPELGKDKTILGKVFEVSYLDRFDPQHQKKELKNRGVKSLEIHTHDFPLSAPEIAKKLGIKEGGTDKAAFTRIDGNLWVIGLKK